MGDTDEQVMTRFLLGALDAEERERVTDRLAEDALYFKEMAAFDDDLILRYHHRQLSPAERALFEKAYLTSPVRSARVDASRALLEAATAVAKQERRSVWSWPLEWLATPWSLPRFALVGAGAAVVIAVSLAAYVIGDARRLRTTEPSPAERVVVAFTLTAQGVRGPGGTQGMDRLQISPDTDELRLSVAIDGSRRSGERFEAELTPVDGGTAEHVSPSIKATDTEVIATVAVAAPPDGDYILTVRRSVDGNSEVVATQAFRVTRSEVPAAR